MIFSPGAFGPAAAGRALTAAVLMALLAFGSPSKPAWAESQAVVVEQAEFLVSVDDGQGRERRIRADIVPFLPNRACFGWQIKLSDAPPVIRYREVLTLPSAPKFWSGENDEYSSHRFSADRTTATTEEFAAPKDGWLSSRWCIAEGDPTGPHSIDVYIDDRLARRFEFEVRAP
ncbi:hypothetical protein HBA54_28015 [Pelagibius litoralis]|uniref:Uncharacterized protein n=1 Tax=Pelagibius litoralis TaxID=374515 RepID=A0A967F3J1_9PROT|nr:hypothetical protein [Pelagibius litoralis]NIA72440.1 hypothetical protein [Pelagibius litoralis]